MVLHNHAFACVFFFYLGHGRVVRKMSKMLKFRQTTTVKEKYTNCLLAAKQFLNGTQYAAVFPLSFFSFPTGLNV